MKKKKMKEERRVDGYAKASPIWEGMSGDSEEKPAKKLRLDGQLLEEKPEVYEAKYPEIYRMVAYQTRFSTDDPEVIARIVRKIAEETQIPEGQKSRLELLRVWDSMLKDYEQKMQASNGYHAIFLPYHMNMHCVPVEYDCRHLRDLSLVALKFFNQANKGEDFVYHSVLMGNYTHQCGRLYRLTFRARPANSTHNDDDYVKEFEAEVAYAPLMGVPIDVGQCTVKTTREYPLYIEQDELAEFAEEAIRSFNEKHKGSHFVLHSLGKGDYTPVVGTTFPITFTAKASNDEEIKKFEAVVKRTQPWVIPSRILVRECFILEEEKPCKAVSAEESAIVVETADEKKSAESCKIDEKTPPYSKTCINEGEERACLISVSGMPVYAGKNSKIHEELRLDSIGGSQMRNPIPFTSSTSPHGLTFKFNGSKSDPSSPLCQQYTVSPFFRFTQSSSLYTATASPPYPFEKDSTPAQVEEEVDPLHELKESEEEKPLHELKESEEEKRLHELKESEEEKRLLPFLVEYNTKLKESDGYLVLPVPVRFYDRAEFHPAYGEEILKELSEEAIQFYNNQHGSEFVFHSSIMASYKPSDIEKRDEKGAYVTIIMRDCLELHSEPGRLNQIIMTKILKNLELQYCIGDGVKIV